jgi:diguanylate cyclase (GGDEF)-like protein/PAS domain S-box-containing protein
MGPILGNRRGKDLRNGSVQSGLNRNIVAVPGDLSRSTGEIHQVASNAAKATGCPMVAVCAEHNGTFSLFQAVGIPEVLLSVLNEMTWLPENPDQNGLFRISIDAPAEPESSNSRRAERVYVGFAAIASTAFDSRRVVLAVITSGKRRALTAAQGYCLQAYAAHVATLLEAEASGGYGFRTGLQDRQRMQSERLRLLESVAVHARDSIIITEAEPVDLPGPRIIYCNAAFTAATGYSEAEVLGRTPRILQGPQTDPASRAKLREMLHAWQPIDIELLNYRKDGTEFWVELSIVPVADERGWFTHWVSVQRDITERKAAEELKTRILVAEVRNSALAAEIQERKRVEAGLLYTAFHDSLTGLRNRAFFMKRLASGLSQYEHQSGTCAVLFLDLDRFKVVNDSLGHGVGDTLLVEIAHRLTQCTRPQDTVARIGGDEFAVLIEDADDLAMVVEIAERIIGALRSPVRLGAQDLYPSCSIGVVQARPGVQVAEDLIRDADIAMYRAKRSGRGDYAIFDESMRADAVAALQLQTDLRQALNRREFLLHYQPIVDPAGGQIVGFEALLRWQHPTRGLLAPAEFISMAEEMALINEIDRRVIREACSQLRVWQSSFNRPALRMSVNASAGELTDTDYVGNLITTLRQTGVDPRMLEIEITEGVFLLPSAATSATFEAIRALGIKIGLDDFGTGYSSLSYINRYPIDTIKIDRSFIASMCEHGATKAIVELIIKLGASLNVAIVAEGVERADQAEMLVAMGCSSAQGYFFARPLSSEAATTLLGASLKPPAAFSAVRSIASDDCTGSDARRNAKLSQ